MKRFFLNWWILTLIAVLLVIVCLCLILPIFIHPLNHLWVRLLLGLAVLLVWGAFAVFKVMKARAAAGAIAKELATPAPGDAEVAVIVRRMTDALALLRKAGGGRRDYLYSRPWYMIIGPPGAGKTTALVNSGLRFPFADSALRGVGGTRNLDFWFADEAVLVDTAGRYTTQDSDVAADERAWHGFLDLLRRRRPLQPINGVLVAVGLDEILRADRAGLDAHAGAVRRRLAELRRTLEVSVPVYVLFTKADLLAGFAEFYDDLDVEGRRAVVGASLPLGQTPEALNLATEFDLLAQSIADRGAKRLHEEPDARRRGLILGFPAQLETLRARALRFLDGAFLAGGEPVGTLRGFYLSSGVQDGAPLDRLLSGTASIYDQPRAASSGRGRAYFLNRLLSEVVIAESGLVEDDPRATARRRTALVGGLSSIAAIAVLILFLWAVSFSANRVLQNRLLAGAQNAQNEIQSVGVDLTEVKASDPDLEQSLSLLRALRELPGGYADRHKGGRPILMTFGLYQSGHAQEAEQAYLGALQRILLPRILLRLEAYFDEHAAEPLLVYEALKTYLMLGGQGPFDARTIKTWVTADWANASYAGADREQLRWQFGEHLDALLENGQPSAVWPDHQAPLDGGRIASARRIAGSLSLADRAYAVLRLKTAGAGAPWRAADVLENGDGRAFAAGDTVLGLSIPYFFTKEGFQKSYLIGLQTVEEDLKADAWVLGSDAKTLAIRSQMSGVGAGVAADYARDYIAAWEAVVKALKPADYFHDPVAFGLFTRTPSPLTQLLGEVRKNTTFSGGGTTAGLAGRVNPRLGELEKVARAGAGGGEDAGQQISSYFKAINDYVGNGKTSPIVEFIAAVNSAHAANSGAASAGGGLAATGAQTQLATQTGNLKDAAAKAPALLQDFANAVAQGGGAVQTSSAKEAVADAYRQDLAPACRTTAEDRYPFVAVAQNDAAVADMFRVFGQGGAFEGFARDRLGKLLETSGPMWRWNSADPVGAQLEPTTAEAFHKASEIADLLTTGLSPQVEGAGFGGAVTSVEISSGGTPWRFEVNTVGAKPLKWSVNSGLPEAHVTLYAGAKELKIFSGRGPWALFRLMDQARKENAGPRAFKATFGEGAAFATLKFTLEGDRNPFRRGSLWSFRCPASL